MLLGRDGIWFWGKLFLRSGFWDVLLPAAEMLLFLSADKVLYCWLISFSFGLIKKNLGLFYSVGLHWKILEKVMIAIVLVGELRYLALCPLVYRLRHSRAVLCACSN